ncbi:unnamed protein product [Didymodactylos carnosus]|uniref:SAM-dependent methyltransferase n=1 Tax=Didymodactylos carnosus TaxID=1234261 RepID=A0A8S2EW40_9BILA|nr:unnamed protein product [Didymodactylos carnosus]CAF4062739.1 unnamed protein product [Didymodactylos carnosus]
MSSDIERRNIMKKHEHYNQNSLDQLKAIEKSFSYIRLAVETHQTPFSPGLLVIADYGSSQGANTLKAIRFIIDQLHQKYSQLLMRVPIVVVYNDLPANDWSTLFRTVQQQSSGAGFSLAAGQSFYHQILPFETLDFGFTSTSIHWLSELPLQIQNHCSFLFANDAELKIWQKQAANDYKIFLQHRSNELKKGGILLIVTLSRANDSSDLTCNHMLDMLYQSALHMHSQNLISDKELLAYNQCDYYRTLDELTNQELLKEVNFECIKSETHRLTNPLYEQYQQGNITLHEFARRYTEYVSSWNESSFRCCLIEKQRTENEKNALIKQFYAEHLRRVQLNPDYFAYNPQRSYIILRKL